MGWFRLLLSPPDSFSSEQIDALCAALIGNGAAGTAIEFDGKISCFVDGTPQDVERLTSHAVREGCTLLSHGEVQEENWNRRCPEVWQSVNAGTIKIVPVESLTDETFVDPGAIKIIPGQGFGTGHHPTTRMILETLSTYAPTLANQQLSIFDLGTGSGILAIAAAKIFHQRVEAIDNDPLAIANAHDNVKLNNVEQLVHLSTTPIDQLKTPFTLILANLYGEVLTQLSSDVTRLALPGGLAIMSGITELVRDSVVDIYTLRHDWILENECSESGWHCITLRRKS